MTFLNKKFASFSIITFLFIVFLPSAANAYPENCGTTQFLGDTSSKTIIFPPGGGTNTDAKVILPIGAVIGDTSVDLTPDSSAIIKTPHIWVPKSNGTITQMRTSNGSIVKAYSTGLNWPSRTFVIPGGDVWTADRAGDSVTKLSPKTGAVAGGACGDGTCNTGETFFSCSADCPNTVGACGGGTYGCEEYDVVGRYYTGPGPRSVTSDTKGNIWVGNCDNGTVVKLNPKTGGILATVTTGGCSYGAIGDSFGNIWISNRAGGQGFNIIDSESTAIIKSNPLPSGLPYGIGMDSSGNIYIAGYESGNVYKYDKNGNLQKTFSTGAINGPRGVAIDSQGNVWTANSANNHLYGFNPAGTRICDYAIGHSGTVGVAIDFNDKIWVVSNDGSVSKIKYEGAACSEEFNANIGATLYNYSDMTGLRSLPSTFTLSSFSTNVSMSEKTAVSGWGGNLQKILTECASPGVVSATDSSLCEAPLSIFSVTAGKFTLNNLKIGCSLNHPSVIGGLVPCGRLDDNLKTDNIDESAPCDLCSAMYMMKSMLNFAVEVAVGIAAFIIILGGFLYAFSAGNPGKIEKAKSAITNSIIGLVIMFSAWLIIASILNAMGYADITTWNQVNCALQTKEE